ncbi:hypothetical protein CBF23_003940 [Marinomonas agarivorans]|nr:hypothetical protein CBF23_003940 [Marinomonas agarivorans]
MTQYIHSPRPINKWRFFLFVTIALLLAATVMHQAYQKNFNNQILSESEQSQLRVQLLSFPRNMAGLASPAPSAPLPTQLLTPLSAQLDTQTQWRFFYVQPPQCDPSCQAQGATLKSFKTEVLFIEPGQPHYDEVWALVRSPNYTVHFDKVLLMNPAGQFAGSVLAPYSDAQLQQIVQALAESQVKPR